jgi:hypothetical protein
MSSKIAVQFRNSLRTRYKYERLRYCKHCSSYSTLWDDRCLSCGHSGSYIRIQELTKTVTYRLGRSSKLWVGIMSAMAVLASRTVTELVLSFVIGTLAFVSFSIIIRRYTPDIAHYRIQKLLMGESNRIRQGLERDLQDADEDIKADRIKEAYEKLREISLLIDNDSIRIRKLMCLQHLILRRDMELELSTLVPEDFNTHFATYLLDVCKLKPQLVNREVIDYVITHRSQIQELPQGQELLTQVAGCVLLVKGYLRNFNGFVSDFINELHRDALLRLCRLLSPEPEVYPELTAKARQAVKLKYEYDPEFQGLLQKGA